MSGGDSFFDSIAQGLNQLKLGLDFNVKSLRLVCKNFARNQLECEKSWLAEALKKENELINEYITSIEFTTNDVKLKSGPVRPLRLTSPIWGRSEIEGRIICKEYDIKIHIVEKHIVEGEETRTHQIIDSEGSKLVDTVDYNEENTVHILNAGRLHFEPILNFDEDQPSEEPSDCSDDSSEEDVKITHGEELFNVVISSDSQEEKLARIKKLFEKEPQLNINFQGQNNDTCLHIAVRKKELQVFGLLVQKGARTDIRNNKGKSPIDVAKRSQIKDIQRLLKPDTQRIFMEEQKERILRKDDEKNKKFVEETNILQLTDGELPPKKHSKVQIGDQMAKGECSELTYKKRVGTGGIGGQLYETRLLMLFLLQAEAKAKNINSFLLATNMEEARDFDDVVFKYEYSENREKKSNIIFLQAKHKESEKSTEGKKNKEAKKCEKDKVIAIDTLLSQSEGGGFILRKYLSSYKKIEQLKFKTEHPFFRGNLDRSEFVIYTNAPLKLDKGSEIIEERNLVCQDMLFIKDVEEKPNNHYYKLNANEAVKNALKHSLDFEVLVRELAKSVHSGNIDFNKPIFQDYHVSLEAEVIEISKTNNKEGKLREDFLNNKENKEFSSAFLEKVRQNYSKKNDAKKNGVKKNGAEKNYALENDKTENNPKENNAKESSKNSPISYDDLKEELRKKVIQLPENFGVADKDYVELSLPDKMFCDEEIEEFLTKLKLFVGQPNVTLLEKIIKNMIKNELMIEDDNDIKLIFSCVHNKIMEWWKEKNTSNYLTEHSRFFHSTKENLSNIRLHATATLQGEMIERHRLNFEWTQIERLSKLIGEKQVVNIISRGNPVLISTLKVCQALKGMTQSKSNDYNCKYIFMTVTSALTLHKQMIDAFKSDRDYLVISCEQTEESFGDTQYGREKTDFKDLYKALSEIIKRNDSKKIILILRENDPFAKKFKNDTSLYNHYEEYEEKDENNTLAKLDPQSQAMIGEKQILFQGKEVRLGALLDEDSKSVIGAGVLSMLTNNEKIEVGKALEDLDEITNGDIHSYYYIDRKLHRQVNISKECFKERNIQDIFVVSNIRGNELEFIADKGKVRKFNDIDLDKEEPVRFITLDGDENVQDKLEQLYIKPKYKTYNIHWLKKESSEFGYKFIWQQSHGDLTNLRKFVDIKDINEYEADKITNIANRIVIVSAEPGMGKSVLLTKLAGEEKKADPSLWVVRINLNRCTEQLKKMNSDEININETFDFLYVVADLKSPLEKKLFKHRVENQGRIALLFDGFDEISPTYKQQTIKLVNILKETKVDKLWITTRPHMRDELEDNVGLFSYSLKPLSTDDQELFLKRFWSKNLGLTIETDEDRVKKYIKQLLDILSSSIADKEKDFTRIPMQIRMLADVYQDKFKEFYYSDQSIPELPSKLNLLDLYQSFIENKYKEWMKKDEVDQTTINMKKLIDSYRSEFVKKHQVLALKVLFFDEEINSLFSKDDEEILKNFKKEIIEGDENTGIINYNYNGTLNFIHRTFAEYFAALWLADNLGRKRVKNLLNSKLFETENRVLRDFFDRILTSNKNSRDNYETHNAVLNNDIKKVEELCSGSANYEVDKGGRTPLHLAAAYGLLEIAEILLNKNSRDIHVEDTIFGWSPLRYADNGSHWRVAELLLQGGANGDDMSNVISNISSVNEYGSTLLHTATEEGFFKFTQLLIQRKANVNAKTQYDNTPLHSASKKGNLDIVKLLIENRADIRGQNRIGDTALHCAARKGNLDVVKFLSEKEADVHCQNTEGDTVLHCAARKGNLDIVKFLTEKGADVHCQNTEGDTILHCAARKGNLDLVKLLIEKGADVKCKNRIDDTVLHFAARKGNLDVVKFLTERGADVHCQNTEGDTILHCAARKGNLDLVKLLIEKGAYVKCKNRIGDTVLHFAAIKGNLDVVKFLIEKGADVHSFWRDDSVLHYAAFWGNLDVVELLIEKGAYVEWKNRNGDTVLHYAARNGNLDVVKLLIEEGADVHCQNTESDTVLHCAARKGNLDVVKFLTEKGADVHCQNTEGDTILHCAARKGNLDIVKLLIKKGANVHSQILSGNSVLHYAAYWGHLDVVKLLIKKGADVNCCNTVGDSIMHYATIKGNWDVMKFLIAKGADFNRQNSGGYTVMHYATFWGNLGMVKLLMEKGANIHCQNIEGNTALYCAAFCDKWDVVKFLAQEGADVNSHSMKGYTFLHWAARRGNLDLVKLLIEKGADVHCQNRIGNPVLHCAAMKGNLDMVKLLIENGADVNCQNRNGDTVLHCAAMKGNLDVVKLLIENGADVNCQNRIGDTVLHCAAIKSNWDITKFLIENGANFNFQSSSGDTVLHYAASWGNLDVVMFLIEKGADVNSQNREGETVLDCAISWRNLDIEKFLAEKVADVNCPYRNDDTVLD